MPLSTPDEMRVLLAHQDMDLTPERLAQAHGIHERSRADLERLRAIPLPFVGAVTEPATALAWIENGGRA